MSYNNTNRLALWGNDKREKATHPHLTGSGETNQEVWVSAWFSDEIADEDRKMLAMILKRYNSKKPFISISLRAKETGSHQKPTSQGPDEFGDDIPF